MAELRSVEDILRLAISKEEASCLFYGDMAEMVEDGDVSKLFEDLAGEERRHKEELEFEIIKRGIVVPPADEVPFRSEADFEMEGELASDLTAQEALTLAVQKENAAFRMYISLLRVAQDDEAIRTFTILAEEEIRHKIKFESAYNRLMKEK